MNRIRPSLPTLASTLLALVTVAGAQERPLQVVQSGPEGEVDSRPEANEIRVVFSEPMVVLGRIPQPVTAPFFRISPQITGSFRWSGTNTLIFTPEDPEKLPYATRFQVTVDGATSVAGKRLAQPHTFAFTTPTVKLLRTEWYRRRDRYDQPVVLLLRFNQPVSVEGVAPHLRFRYEPHEWTAPVPEPAALERMRAADPASVDDFRAKVQKTEEAVRLSGVVAARPTTDWNKATHPPARDLLALETAEVPPTDAWIRVELGPDARGVEGPATPGRVQSYTVKLEPTLFVAGFRCAKACDPDSYNPLRLRGQVTLASLRGVTAASDVTDPLQPATLQKTRRTTEADEEAVGEDYEYAYDRSSSFTLDDVGFTLRPARTYAITVGRALGATDGQILGYTWAGLVERWHQTAFTSFGTGHGVWESSGGSRLPFSARNLRTVQQWLAPLSVDELTPRIVDLQKKSFWDHPETLAVTRRLSPTPDRIQAVGIDLKPVLSSTGAGLAWAALREGQPIPKAHHDPNPRSRSSVVQVTNLGLSVKDSPQNTLVLVTRLSDAAPVEGARVSIRKLDNTVFWSGLTDKDGLAQAPRTALRDPERTWELAFVVTAEKDGDVAYVGSDWNDGVEPWYFGHHLDLHEAQPLLRGAVFADRGVYRLGEEVHLKAVLRSDTPEGVRLIEKGTAVEIVTTDSQANELDKRTVALNEWSSAEWTFEVPEGAPLGTYQVQATIGGQRSAAIGSFLVAAYRRPDFRVDVNLAGEAPVAGVKLKGVVTARYLFGAPMAARDVRWTYSRLPLDTPPAAVIRRPESEKYVFVDEERDDRWTRRAPESLQQRPGVLDAQGQLELDLDTDLVAGRPYEYTLEGDVTDLSRQTIAGRASFRVEPAPWYVGLRRPSYFADVARGVDTDVVAVGLDGAAVVGVPVKVTLTQVQWHAVRRAEGHGFYTWESERKEVAVDAWDVTTTAEPAPLHVPIQTGGYFVLRATAKEADGRWTTSATSFYVLGPGYTAWERHDHNRIDLVPEKKRYRPGDTARIMIKSPWEKAHVLLTTEREGVRTWRTFDLASTQETVSVPITESDIPNLYVSVMLVKGRSGGFDAKDSGDPGKPAFRVGYVELEVDDGSKHLDVAVKSDKEEYRPASTAQVEVQVKDTQGRGVAAEVTLWAVDYGVLSLTGYRTPDVRGRVWVEKALQVMTGDSRQNIVSRRVIVPKGGEEGGGGGGDDGSGEPVRRDFRVLAFWLGSLTTDASGRARTDVLLPESLTTYRIMAVAADKASRFGSDDREVRISKPVLLKPAFPRFLARGDVAEFGAVVHSQLKEKGTAIVTMRSLDPALLEVTGDARKTVTLPARGAAEVRFGVRAKAVGRPRLQMTVRLQGEADAFEDAVPVEVLASPEVVAAYGQANPEAKETVELPEGVVPGFGGLHVETSSTALVGLGEGARYLVDYPYGCAEQRASAALALALASDLGEAFRLPGVEPAKLHEIAQGTFKELEEYQCESGGFAFWKGNCRTVSPYVTSYVLHVLQKGKALSYSVTPSVLENGYGYLERELGGERPTNEGWWPAYTAWQAFAIKVLAEGGQPQDSHATRLFGFIDRMPVFGMAYLRDAMLVSGDKTPRPAELERRMRNAILPEGGSAHVEELSDPYLLYFWNSSVRSTALALDSFVRHGGPEELIPRMVRWLMQVRKKGRWGNTQENATAMEALVAYYKKYESEVPEFRGTVALGGETLATPVFRGRSTRAQVADVPMRRLAEKAKPGERLDLTFKKEGTGTMFYVAQLKYAVDAILQDAMDQGFRVERSYAADSGGAPATTFTAGDLVKVTLTLRLTKERRFVAVTDPLPAGLEPVEAWFATTASSLAREQRDQEDGGDWMSWWQGGGFDRVERHDDRVLLFATRLSEGEHVFSYVARATTSGTFRTAPAHAEEMYEPEVFGRTPTAVVTVTPIPEP